MPDGEVVERGYVLVTGATGYVGGRLVTRLLEAGYRVRIMVRSPKRASGRPWFDDVDVVQGDALKPETLVKAMDGIAAAYYLIHSMTAHSDFHERDMQAAGNFAQAAQEAGVSRIIYLGGLGDSEADLSAHLRSRQKTGEMLRSTGVAVTEFRAAVVVGSGSASFEIIRNLTERLPVMICPRWVYKRIQPIAISNVLDYLVSALRVPESAGSILEIGGPDILRYADMMLGYAEARGLRRLLIPVPALTPTLSSYWVHWMTPVQKTIARPLIEGVRNDVIVTNDRAQQIFPDIALLDYDTAVARALARLDAGDVETTWNDALVSSQGAATPVQFTTQDGMLIERREADVAATRETVYDTFTAVGGERGWPFWNWAWVVRGIVDRLVGGVGFRRSRRHPEHLRPGDALDFWRVEEVDAGHLLRLRAEMKVPGRAWWQFEATPLEDGRTRLAQTAFFASKGVLGLLYWYGLYPLHAIIFSGMIRKLAEQAEAQQQRIVPVDAGATT